MNDLVERGRATLSLSYAPRPVVFDRGDGVHLYDVDGNEYLDFLAGIAVCALGHAHPALTEALRDQAGKLLHVSNAFFNEPQVLLQERLTELSGLDRVFFCNSGAEANEAAIKLARRYQRVTRGTPRFEVITFEKSFHGRTLGALSATGQPKYHAGFEPIVPGFVYAKFNDIASVRSLVGAHTAAILVEPIQGEGGVLPASATFLESLRALCDEEGIVLIFDEVQCGVGRTGSWFAADHYGVRPDIMSLAKGIGGGVPLGAMLASERLAQGFTRGSHATTYGGNPLATRAGLTVFDTIAKDGLLARVRDTSAYLREQLETLAARDPRLGEVRGVGLMLGLQCVDAQAAGAIAASALKHRLLLNTAGGDVLRFVPPLITQRAHVDDAIERLSIALNA